MDESKSEVSDFLAAEPSRLKDELIIIHKSPCQEV